MKGHLTGRLAGAMRTSPATRHDLDRAVGTTPRPVVVIAVLTALGCVGFAAVNVVYELTGRVDDGQYAEYAAGFAVMNWLVVGLKLLGAVVALSSVADHPRRPSPPVLTALVWGAFATLGFYALGSVAQAISMATGVSGSRDQIDVAGVLYVVFFTSAAVCYGVLAVSYSHRHRVGRTPAVVGVVGAPALLFLLLVLVPTLLSAVGVMPPLR